MSSELSHRPKHDPKMARLASLSAFFGSTVEYYDFIIFATAASIVFNKVFFEGLGPAGATLASLATFGVAYVARPLGAVVFGSLGDRRGRQHVLVLTLILMGSATFIVGLLPTDGQIGIAAPIILVVCRILQGLSAGGEQAGSNALTSEHAPDGKRGLYTSWTMQGVTAGTLLGSAAFIPITAMGQDVLLSWGWRIPFLIAGPLILVAVWIRRKVQDPDVFTEDRAQARHTSENVPLVQLFRDYWANIVRVIFCSLYAITGSMMSVFTLSYGVDKLGLNASTLLAILTGTMVVTLVTQPLWAAWSDRIGRRPVFISSVLAIAAVFFLVFGALHSGNYVLIAGSYLLLALVAGGGNVVQASMYTEMFPTRVRYTGYAVGTQVGLVVVGFSPTIAASLQGEGSTGWLPVAFFIAICMLIAAGSALSAKETHRLRIEEIGERPEERAATAPPASMRHAPTP